MNHAGIFNREFRYPYQAADGRENRDSESACVLRGGSFRNLAWYVRCASRRNLDDFWLGDLGFRVCVSPGL